MENMITAENVTLYDTIILNGKVGYCETGDDCGETIGVKTLQRIKRLDGSYVEQVVGEFPFSKKMEDKTCWKQCVASIQMLTGDTPIDIDHIDETKIVSMMGEVESEYYHRYSDYTGYLWTDEEFKCGGHDLLAILKSHMNEYIHIEIELYKVNKVNK